MDEINATVSLTYLVSVNGFPTIFILTAVCVFVLPFWILFRASDSSFGGDLIGLDLLAVHAL